jgi:hypothetical protein
MCKRMLKDLNMKFNAKVSGRDGEKELAAVHAASG